MKTKSKSTRIRRRPPTVPHGLRFPTRTSDILRYTARKERCYSSDIVRTAVDEYIERNELWRNLPAKKAKEAK